ncbi:TPA: conjugation system SOS inhibitor PsiB [Salmonella enterica subsp. enterica serovar Derby]
MKEQSLSLSCIRGMNPGDFEEIRARGHEARREMTHSVVSKLITPEGWELNPEYRGEFGGLFPVQCRFSSATRALDLCLCSPGDLSPAWILVLAQPDGLFVRCVVQLADFSPNILNRLLQAAAVMEANGYSPSSMADVLETDAHKLMDCQFD